MADSLRDSLLENGAAAVEDTRDAEQGLNKEEESSSWFFPELERQFWLAVPMIGVNILQYSLNLISIMFVGHLGELALASAALAGSFAGVTGFGVLMGMAAALETLCGQAYGAKQYHMLGIYVQRAVLVLNCVSIPIALVWAFMGPILRLLGQDSEISEYAGLYARWLIPTLFAYAALQPLVKFLQTQSAVLPMACCSALTLCVHIPLCWLLTYKTALGYRGAALSSGISQWLNVTFLALYIKFGPTGKKTWSGFSSRAFQDMKGFFALAAPSAVMVCLEYWTFEFMVLLSGLLPNPQLETSALSICMNTIALMYMIAFGLSASVSTRVSNELGAGRALAAKRAGRVGLCFAFIEAIGLALIVFFARYAWAYAFTGVAEVVNYVVELIPFLCVLAVLDACQSNLSGVTRGRGAQALGACTNLFSYYVVGLPLAIALGFYFHLTGRGLWLGVIAAQIVQNTALATITLRVDWEEQAREALERVYSGYGQLPIEKLT